MAGSGQHFPMSAAGTLAGTMMTSAPGAVVSSSGFSQTQTATQMSGGTHAQSFPATGQQPQQPQQQPAPGQMMSPTKTVNAVTACKLGQETNQELVTRLLDVFKHFKAMQLPSGPQASQYQDRRLKMEESLRQLSMVFRKLRLIYDKVSELIVDPDENPEEALVPLKGDPLEEKNTDSDAFKHASEEYKQLIEQLQLKNKLIKEVIDKVRTIMWEINTMILMRKT